MAAAVNVRRSEILSELVLEAAALDVIAERSRLLDELRILQLIERARDLVLEAVGSLGEPPEGGPWYLPDRVVQP